MSTIITRATLERNLPYFLAQVLRNVLTDTHSPVRQGKDWILKSQPSDDIDPATLPRITVELEPVNYENWNIDGTKYNPQRIMVEAWIMTGGSNTSLGAKADRDAYTDSVREALFDPTSADSDGLSLGGNHIIMRSFSSDVGDFKPKNHPKTIRAKRVSMEFKYYGG